MATRQIKTPGVTDPEPTQDVLSEIQNNEADGQQVPEPTYEELKEHLIQEQNKHIQFLNDSTLLEARLRELKPELFNSEESKSAEVQNHRVVLGKHGWTKENY